MLLWKINMLKNTQKKWCSLKKAKANHESTSTLCFFLSLVCNFFFLYFSHTTHQNQDRKLTSGKRILGIQVRDTTNIKEMETGLLGSEFSGFQNRARLSWSIFSCWCVCNSCPWLGFSSTIWLHAASLLSIRNCFSLDPSSPRPAIYMNLIITLRLLILHPICLKMSSSCRKFPR